MGLLRLVEKKDDAKLWSPIDALREMLAKAESGELVPEKIFIIYEYKEGEQRQYGYTTAGTTMHERIALLEILKQRAIMELI